MTAFPLPSATLSHLHRTDGSATFSHNGYTVIAAVNGPIEVQRRDELPSEAAIDILVRPAAGVGGTRERHLESLIQATLRQIILIQEFPRTLIQVTLQVTSTPENDRAASKLNQASADLPLLPALLQASTLALLSSGTPLSTPLASILLALSRNKKILIDPSPLELQSAESVHVFAFTSHGDLLLAESEGTFTLQEWQEVCEAAERFCCDVGEDEAVMKDVDVADAVGNGEMGRFVRGVAREKVENDLRWRR